MLLCCGIHSCRMLLLGNSVCLLKVNVPCYIWVTCYMPQLFSFFFFLRKKVIASLSAVTFLPVYSHMKWTGWTTWWQLIRCACCVVCCVDTGTSYLQKAKLMGVFSSCFSGLTPFGFVCFRLLKAFQRDRKWTWHGHPSLCLNRCLLRGVSFLSALLVKPCLLILKNVIDIGKHVSSLFDTETRHLLPWTSRRVS